MCMFNLFIRTFLRNAIVTSAPRYPNVPDIQNAREFGISKYTHNNPIKKPANPDPNPLARNNLSVKEVELHK